VLFAVTGGFEGFFQLYSVFLIGESEVFVFGSAFCYCSFDGVSECVLFVVVLEHLV